MEEAAAVEFQAEPEIWEHLFKGRSLDKEFRTLWIALRIAAGYLAKSKSQLIETVDDLISTQEGAKTFEGGLDFLQNAEKRFRDFGELVDVAYVRQVIAAAAACATEEERKGGSP